jgi:hypothetical protein
MACCSGLGKHRCRGRGRSVFVLRPQVWQITTAAIHGCPNANDRRSRSPIADGSGRDCPIANGPTSELA